MEPEAKLTPAGTTRVDPLWAPVEKGQRVPPGAVKAGRTSGDGVLYECTWVPHPACRRMSRSEARREHR
jgi:hypothetical protein